MLYKPMALSNSRETQLSYKLTYFPYRSLSAAARRYISHRKSMAFSKQEILEKMDETLSYLLHEGKQYKIGWGFNNIPTKREWDKLADSHEIYIELRICNPTLCGNIAILFLSYTHF